MPVAALILGILGLLGSIFGMGFFSFLGIPFALIALILGILARKKLAAENQPTGMATAGLVMGIVGLALGVVLTAACWACANKVSNEMNKQMQNDPELKKKMDDFQKQLKDNANK